MLKFLRYLKIIKNFQKMFLKSKFLLHKIDFNYFQNNYFTKFKNNLFKGYNINKIKISSQEKFIQ